MILKLDQPLQMEQSCQQKGSDDSCKEVVYEEITNKPPSDGCKVNAAYNILSK